VDRGSNACKLGIDETVGGGNAIVVDDAVVSDCSLVSVLTMNEPEKKK
jgi:hypothetical protein